MADQIKTIDIIVNTDKAVKEVDKLNKSLDENKEETEDATKETKKYEQQLKDTEKVTGAFTTQMDKLTGGLYSSVKGMLTAVKGLKSLKVALIATGFGAIVVVVGAIATAFTKLEGPMRQVEEILGGLGGVLGELTERFGILGQSLIDLISGDWESAVKGWTLAWKDLNKEVKEAWELGQLVAKQTRENNVQESARGVIIANNNREIERQLLLSRDIEKSIKERQTAIAEANKLQKENIDLNLESARERLIIAENEFDLSPVGKTGKKTSAAIIAINNARTEYTQSQLSAEIRLRDLENRRVDLYRQELQLNKQTTIERTKQLNLQEAQETSLEDLNSEYDRLLQGATEFGDKSEAAANNITLTYDEAGEAATKAEDDQQGLNNALGVTTQAAKGLLDVFQGKVEGKDIFKSVLNTLGGILNLVLPGASAVTGLIGGLFADGGLLKGPSHDKGGIWVNAEGGEGIINKRSMSIPWVRDLASELNQIGGGVKFADGGIVAGQTAQEQQISQLSQSLQQQRIVLPIEDLYTLDTKVTAVEDRATL